VPLSIAGRAVEALAEEHGRAEAAEACAAERFDLMVGLGEGLDLIANLLIEARGATAGEGRDQVSRALGVAEGMRAALNGALGISEVPS
jgi:hypothetical protein